MADLTPVVLWYTPDEETGRTSIRVRLYEDATAILEQSVEADALIASNDVAVAVLQRSLVDAVRLNLPKVLAERAINDAIWREHPDGIILTADIADTIEKDYPAEVSK